MGRYRLRRWLSALAVPQSHELVMHTNIDLDPPEIGSANFGLPVHRLIG
jgi:hypothetical protein